MPQVRIISLIDIEAAGGIDPARLGRALKLTTRRIERGRYETTSVDAIHYVDLIDPAMERCDCADFIWRQVVCQHVLACLLREGDERVLQAVSRLVLSLTEENRQLRANVRGRTIPLTLSLKARAAEAAGVHVDDLEFRRDDTDSSSDVAVHLRGSGALIGYLTRSASRPQFVPTGKVPSPPFQLRVAACARSPGAGCASPRTSAVRGAQSTADILPRGRESIPDWAPVASSISSRYGTRPRTNADAAALPRGFPVRRALGLCTEGNRP